MLVSRTPKYINKNATENHESDKINTYKNAATNLPTMSLLLFGTATTLIPNCPVLNSEPAITDPRITNRIPGLKMLASMLSFNSPKT